MSAPRDPDVILATWLDDGPEDLPSTTRRAISTAVRTTPQARAHRLGLPVWRPTMSRTVTIAATAALVALAIGAFVVGGGPGAVPPSEVPSTPSAPAPTLAGDVSLDWTTWQDFTASRYGYRARYPTGWTAMPATRDWSVDMDLGDWNGPASEKFLGVTPAGRSSVLSAFSVDAGSTTLDNWIQLVVGTGTCPVIEEPPVVIDGHPGSFISTNCGDSAAFVLVDGNLYVFRKGRDGPRDLLQAFLATVHIDAVSTPAGGTLSQRPDSLEPVTWPIYGSTRYSLGNNSTIGYPADWTLHRSDHVWTYKADGHDALSTGQEAFLNPEGDVRVSAWDVPRDPAEGTMWADSAAETWANIEAWAQAYCERTGNTPCSDIHGRAVPLCLEKWDCHPALLVPFQDDVQAFFTNGGEGAPMTIVAVWRGPSDPSTARYGGSRRLLEAFLSTMDVLPAVMSPSEQTRDAAASFEANRP